MNNDSWSSVRVVQGQYSKKKKNVPQAAFSPDGTFYIVQKGDGLFAVNLQTAEATRVTKKVNVNGGDIVFDGPGTFIR